MQQLNPKAVWLFFISFLARTSPFFAMLVFVGLYDLFDGDVVAIEPMATLITLLPVFIPLLILIAWLWARLSYQYYKYELREDGFRKEYGVIWKKYATIPYDRVQNVDIYRGLIARLLGLSDLQIQTAGGLTDGSYGAFSEGRLPGLSRDIAEQMRDELIKRVRSSKGQGL